MVFRPYSKGLLKGDLAEALARIPFQRAGYLIFHKIAPAPVDFVAFHPDSGEICKVEVKGCSINKQGRLVGAQLTARQRKFADLVALVETTSGRIELVLPESVPQMLE